MIRADTAPASLSLPETPLWGVVLAAFILLLMGVSTFALLALGWQYGEAGSNPLQKLHPATYMAAGLVALAAIQRGNPLTAVVQALSEHPLIVVYLMGVAGLLAHATLVVGLPAAGFIDTFILPVMVLFLVRDVSPERRLALAQVMHVFMAVNAALGVVEMETGFRLTPIFVEGETLEEEWRASALLGHPLGNALLTGAYMILILAGQDRGLPKVLRAPALLLAAAGMVAFGGRAATGFVLVALVYILLARLVRVLAGEPFDSRTLLAMLLAFPFIALAVVALNDAGFFEQFVARLADDEGSASTRVAMLELFKHVGWYDLLFGPDPRFIASLMSMYGLTYGIESFWVAMIFQHGIVVAVPFFLCLFAFAAELLRGTGRAGVLLMLYFFAVASASLSLSAKSVVFAIFVLLLMILAFTPAPRALPKRASEAASRAPAQGRLPAQARSRRRPVVPAGSLMP